MAGLCERALEYVKNLAECESEVFERCWDGPNGHPIYEVTQEDIRNQENEPVRLKCLMTYVFGLGMVRLFEWTRNPTLPNGVFVPETAQYWWEPCLGSSQL